MTEVMEQFCRESGDLIPPDSLRPPSQVMRLERLGSLHPSRLSFTRTLIRRIYKENWKFERRIVDFDDNGFGHIVYRIHTPQGKLSFIAFSNEISDSERTDRVIAEKWDLSFTLFNGVAGAAEVERLKSQVPLQELGRMSESEIVLSRANKSTRLFNSIVDCLASGKQPNAEEIARIGYLVRTTAVYGNGKFGLMDFNQVKRFTPFNLPFQAEMLTVYMARQLSIDLIEHIARSKGGNNAVGLSKDLKVAIGVGNATGLGMAPFLVGHPQLIHQWIKTRESAIAKVKLVKRADGKACQRFSQLLDRFKKHLAQWQTEDLRQSKRLELLQDEIEMVDAISNNLNGQDYPWRYLIEHAFKSASLECQELLHSIMLEIYPELVNELEQQMGVEEFIKIDTTMTIAELSCHIKSRYEWALNYNFESPSSQHYFWYMSQEKEEPRLGLRYEEPGCELEMPVGIARDVNRLYSIINSMPHTRCNITIAEFLIQYPSLRYIVMRIQSLRDFPYGEIQDNLLDSQCCPLDILRCKLAMFGATRFDPKSKLWTRITLFQGAPLFNEIDSSRFDDWAFPFVKLDALPKTVND